LCAPCLAPCLPSGEDAVAANHAATSIANALNQAA